MNQMHFSVFVNPTLGNAQFCLDGSIKIPCNNNRTASFTERAGTPCPASSMCFLNYRSAAVKTPLPKFKPELAVPRLSQSGRSTRWLQPASPRSFQPCASFAVASPPREKRGGQARLLDQHRLTALHPAFPYTRGRPKGRLLSHLPGFLGNFSLPDGADRNDPSPSPLLSPLAGYSLVGTH